MASDTAVAPILATILRNASASSVAKAVDIAVRLLLVPFVIATVGIERFGVWSLCIAIVSYGGLMDGGLDSALSPFVARHQAAGDREGQRRTIATAVYFYGGLGLLLTLAVWLLADLLVSIFQMPAAFRAEAAQVLRLSALNFALANAATVFTSSLQGLQRFGLSATFRTAYVLLMGAGSAVALTTGWGLPGLMAATLAATAVSGLLSAGAVLVLLPQVRLSPKDCSRETLKGLLSFGSRIWVSKMASLVVGYTDRLFIGAALSVSLLGMYEVGAKIAFTMRDIALLGTAPVIPAASHLSAADDRGALRELYERGMGIVLAGVLPLFAFVALTAPAIVCLWVGSAYPVSQTVCRILLAGCTVSVIMLYSASISTGSGRPEMQMWYAVTAVVAQLALLPAAVLVWGWVGAAWATSTTIALGSVVFFILFFRRGYGAPAALAGSLAWPALAALLAAVPVLVLSPGSPPATRGGAAAQLALSGALFAALYGSLTWLRWKLLTGRAAAGARP
ncbi:MAG: oligosaccharide flippase family protein [Gemmatimonadota bacterium]